MTADRPLLDRLRNYLTLNTGLDGASLQGDFTWPAESGALSENFPLFHWLSTAEASPRIFGIRRLVDQSPFRLSDLRARGFRTESSRRPVRPPIKGSVEHYLIAELTGPETALVYLSMYSPTGEWYVLDEHRIVRG